MLWDTTYKKRTLLLGCLDSQRSVELANLQRAGGYPVSVNALRT